MINLNTECCQ